MGETLVALGRAAEAVGLLRDALASTRDRTADPSVAGRYRFLLATALWDAPEGEGRDRAEARALAEQARLDYEVATDYTQRERDELLRWLREH